MSLNRIVKSLLTVKLQNHYGHINKMMSRNLVVCGHLQNMSVGSRGYTMSSNALLTRHAVQSQAQAFCLQKAHIFSASKKPQGPPPIPPKLPRTHPEKGDLVYVGPLTDIVKAVKVFSFTTSVLMLSMLPMWLSAKMSTAMFGVIFGTGGMIMVITPFLIHFIARNYVTHMYYNESKDEFHSTTYSFFLRPKQLVFSPKEVEICYDESLFKTAEVQGKSLFVDKFGFLEEDHYVKFMKFDEPFDLISETEKVKKYLEEKKKREEEEGKYQEKIKESG